MSVAEREEAFAELRRDAPVSWQRPSDSVLMGPEIPTTGYWAIVRYADVRAVSRDPNSQFPVPSS
jgi:cytochrome P450